MSRVLYANESIQLKLIHDNKALSSFDFARNSKAVVGPKFVCSNLIQPVKWVQRVAESQDVKNHEVDVGGQLAAEFYDRCLAVFVVQGECEGKPHRQQDNHAGQKEKDFVPRPVANSSQVLSTRIFILFAFSQHLGEVTPAEGVHVVWVVPEVTLETMPKVSSGFPLPF